MIHYWKSSTSVRDRIFIPKYYDPAISDAIARLSATHDCVSVGELCDSGALVAATGHEIGKAAYGTGDVPFVRTSDIANWEIKAAPKQGVSQSIYDEYANKQDVNVGDILLVRDGTYLIGRNCFITPIDKHLLYQSHILKLRVMDGQRIDPTLLFLCLNTRLVQMQVRSFQFSADIIDTIGRRFRELVLPFPKSETLRKRLIAQTSAALLERMHGKAFVKHCPVMLEEVLRTGSSEPIEAFVQLRGDAIGEVVVNEVVSAELGTFTSFWRQSDSVHDLIFLPKYYDSSIRRELDEVSTYCELRSVRELVDEGQIEYHTGDEIGKMAYGTGEIPFLRTSDFANWEISHNPKQGVSEEIYERYAGSEDVQEGDVLLVRDGTYLVGSSCIITKEDVKSLYCGGLFKFRVMRESLLDPFLLLGILNSYVVKRQIRTKQFTRDVIDTVGNRIGEVILPIPRCRSIREAIGVAVQSVVVSRMQGRERIRALSAEVAPGGGTGR